MLMLMGSPPAGLFHPGLARRSTEAGNRDAGRGSDARRSRGAHCDSRERAAEAQRRPCSDGWTGLRGGQDGLRDVKMCKISHQRCQRSGCGNTQDDEARDINGRLRHRCSSARAPRVVRRMHREGPHSLQRRPLSVHKDDNPSTTSLVGQRGQTQRTRKVVGQLGVSPL